MSDIEQLTRVTRAVKRAVNREDGELVLSALATVFIDAVCQAMMQASDTELVKSEVRRFADRLIMLSERGTPENIRALALHLADEVAGDDAIH